MVRSRESKATAPLRRIVEVLKAATDIYGSQRVKLECGHEASASGGAIYKARCTRCRREETGTQAPRQAGSGGTA